MPEDDHRAIIYATQSLQIGIESVKPFKSPSHLATQVQMSKITK